MSLTSDTDLVACGDLVRRGDPARFQAAMAAPVAARHVLFPIYAFNIEVARAPWVTQEPMIAEMRLQWWRDALEQIRSGDGARRHEVVTPLARVLDAERADLLDELIAARRRDIERVPFDSDADFSRYLAATSGNLMLVGARALGPVADDVVRDAGFALGLANWFRAIPALEAAGRRPLPDGRPDAVRAWAEEGLRCLARARSGRARVSRAASPAMLPLWEVGPILRQVVRLPRAVGEGALAVSPARSKATLFTRAMSGMW
ncbi:squalene/phytoene synthase family protein [Roseovarius tibetensis]|uniref:squalene/phytoene synthase family protein n=1 Tax=Roseovarius tibetensis TaxID=2685897 RepID=UPI003D7F444D